ncbi:MAG: MaoC family dehydratase N-terminal domain-containing protein [Bifidobacteriaceae bacterium]|jgi:acyl dehydratase|nr:MaoC family dehydratase N-terminal domain-containing protein [Bifidobacteriaceae bacterium]
MPVNPAFVGRTYRSAASHQVEREELREFAAATGLTEATSPACFDPTAAQAVGYPDVVAAPTFAVVIAQRAEAEYIRDPAAGIDFTRVVHAAESFVHHRPITAADRVSTELTVVAVAERRGIATVTTKVDLSDAAGQPLATVTSTLAVRGEAA